MMCCIIHYQICREPIMECMFVCLMPAMLRVISHKLDLTKYSLSRLCSVPATSSSCTIYLSWHEHCFHACRAVAITACLTVKRLLQTSAALLPRRVPQCYDSFMHTLPKYQYLHCFAVAACAMWHIQYKLCIAVTILESGPHFRWVVSYLNDKLWLKLPQQQR